MRSIELDDYNCARSRRDGKQDWGELYRAAILESDENMLQQRIKDALGAISDRSARLAKRTDSHGKEQDDIARALHMLSLLQRQPRH